MLASLFACNPEPPPALHFDYVQKEPVYHFDKSTADLRRIGSTVSGVNRNDFPITSGLTQGKVLLDTEMHLKTIDKMDGRVCAWAEKINVTVTYTAEINIAREYKDSRCRFAQIKAHELRHVATDIATIREFLPRMKKRAAARAAEMQPLGPLDASRKDELRERLLSRIMNVLNEDLQVLDGLRHLRQQMIDTPAEYMRLSRACPREPIR